jgi:hypothetical protein
MSNRLLSRGSRTQYAAAKPTAVAVFGGLDEQPAPLLVDQLGAEADEFVGEGGG